MCCKCKNKQKSQSCKCQYEYTTECTKIIIQGATGPKGCPGDNGVGIPGPPGIPGKDGISAIINFANFYSIIPPDNVNSTIAPGASIEFTTDGPAQGTITRVNNTQFNIADIGIYEVLFQASVDESGQLVIAINGIQIPYTVVGRATGTSQIVGMSLIQITSINSILSINNPLLNSTALTLTPLAGGFNGVSAQLIIKQLS